MENITYSAKTLEAIEAVSKAVEVAEHARKEGNLVDLPTNLDNAKQAVKTANDAIIKDACATFVELFNADPAAFVSSYWSDWTIEGFRLKVADDEISAEGAYLRVLLSAIDRNAKVPMFSNGAWRSYLRIYADNIFQYIAENDKGENAVCTKTPLPADLIAKRKQAEKHWQKHSHSALVQQLNDLVKMIFPANVQPGFNMVSVDQKTITAAIAKATNLVGNNATKLQLANIVTLEKILCTQIYTRMSGLAVELDTGFKDKSEKPNQPKKDEAKPTGAAKSGAKNAPAKAAKTAEKTVPADTTAA